VTAADVVYGIARSFRPDLTGGQHTLQNWLTGHPSYSPDYNLTYRGPGHGGADVPPGVSVDGNQITFTFSQRHCDLPYVAALPVSAAVPKAHDTGLSYDGAPWSDGPYKVGQSVAGKSVSLVRNPYWDPLTDAVRNAFPDQMRFLLNLSPASIKLRLSADEGDDQTALTWVTLPNRPEVSFDAHQIVKGSKQFNEYLFINNRRVADANVRIALNIALDRFSVLRAAGGDIVGSTITMIEPPQTFGFRDYNAYGVDPQGDSAKARERMDGQTPQLTLCYPAGTTRVAEAMRDSLGKAGFLIVPRPIAVASYAETIGRRDNTCDLYPSGWTADWPTGEASLAALLDGRSIAATGNIDLSYYDNPTIDAEIDRIEAEAGVNPVQAAYDWSTLDQTVLTQDAPLIPLYNGSTVGVFGSRVGDAFLSTVYGLPSLTSVYVKSP
jgi:peptide/nickel transport system substrate-binding protein